MSLYSATVDWGDGTTLDPDTENSTDPNPNVFIVQEGNTFLVEGTHVYETAGNYTITTTIHHDVAPDAIVTESADVSNGVGPASGQFFEFSAPTYTASDADGATYATITVTRTGGTTGTVDVGYTTYDGTAKAGTDYTAASGTLTFAPGVTSQTFQVLILEPNDNGVGSENFYLGLTSADNGAALGGPSLATFTIDEPYTGQTFQFGSPTYTVDEASGRRRRSRSRASAAAPARPRWTMPRATARRPRGPTTRRPAAH